MISKLSLMISYIKEGYWVYNEINNTGPIDFIAVHPETKEVLKIDAKTCSRRESGPQSGTMIHRIRSQEQKDLGLNVLQSNLCSEITLPTNEERTAVCCLSSVNLEYFDDWKDSDSFIDDMITMLDNVLEHFIEHSVDTQAMGKYNANYERFKNYVKESIKGFTKAA